MNIYNIFPYTTLYRSNVWFYDMEKDGFSLNDNRTPIDENDIPDIIERFHNLDKEEERERTDKSFLVPFEEIKENDYDLSIRSEEHTSVLQLVVHLVIH